MKVLVSAFTPFNNNINNYSSQVLKHLKNVDKIILDVTYDKSFISLNNSVNLDEYDLIIALGEARSRNELTLELKAVNVSSCTLKDNDGVYKENEKINDKLPDFLSSKVDVSKCVNDIKISYDAGKFVCNNLYFHLLEKYDNKSLFIHIPNCNDDEKQYIKYANKINEIINKLL